jgi:Ni,Fe-hydrogenase I cytochrome b subunit
MEKHINIIAALRIGFSILGILIGSIFFIVLYFIGDIADDQEASFVLSIIANVIMVFVIVLSIPGIIAGIGLFKRKEWARVLTLILSVLDLFNIPFGTAIGAYSIWALAQPETAELFKTSHE